MFTPRLLKRLVRPLGLAALALACHATPALAYSFKLTTFPSSPNLSHGSILFNDILNFTIAGPTTSKILVTLKPGEEPGGRASDFTLSIYSTLDPLHAIASDNGDPGGLAANLGNGSYFAKIADATDNPVSGNYLFSWAAAVTPVPEPAEWILLSLGLVGIAAGARRKRG